MVHAFGWYLEVAGCQNRHWKNWIMSLPTLHNRWANKRVLMVHRVRKRTKRNYSIFSQKLRYQVPVENFIFPVLFALKCPTLNLLCHYIASSSARNPLTWYFDSSRCTLQSSSNSIELNSAFPRSVVFFSSRKYRHSRRVTGIVMRVCYSPEV